MSAPPPPVASRRGPDVSVVSASFDFTATGEDQLSVAAEETLYVIDKTHADWWMCRNGDGVVGLVPCNHLRDNVIANPLHEAAKRGNVDMVKQMIGNGVSVNGLDNAQNTALHWAARGGHASCITALLYIPTKQGGVILSPNIILNQQNLLGDTPLHCAAFKGSAPSVRLLLDAAKQKNVQLLLMKNRDGKLAEDLATNYEAAAPLKQARLNVQNALKSSGEDDYNSDD
jgi:ankyrin repeat protein